MYNHTCAVCNGRIVSLPDLADGPFDDILDRIARELYTEKVNTGTIDKELYKKTAERIMEAVDGGLGGSSFRFDDSRNSLRAFLMQNVHEFSAAKSMYQMRHFANMMIREDGTTRDFTSFRNKVMSAGYEFNVAHLQTEYNTALSSAQMAQQWQGFNDNDVEWLQYSTAGDDRVRPEHAALDGFTAKITDPVWNTIYPPNAWNCRCHVIPGIEQNSGKVFIDNSTKKWAKEKYNIDPYFQKNSGSTKAVFNIDGPVYKMSSIEKNLLAVKNYNMKPVKDILLDNKWPQPIPATSANDAKLWWRQVTGGAGYKDYQVNGLNIRIDDEFIRHTVDDNKDSRWLFIKSIQPIIEDADEVWATRIDDVAALVIIKYLEGLPIAVRIDAATMRPYTSHSLLRKGVLNESQTISLRKGALVYRKN